MARAKIDPFEVIGPVPKGKTYQWITLSVCGDTDNWVTDLEVFKASGWKPVPATRHPKMPRKGKQIVFRGQLLVERSKKLSDAARATEISHARKAHDESSIKSGDSLVYYPSGASFKRIAAAAAGATPDPQVIRDEIDAAGGAVKVEIGIELTEREIDACAYLSLTAKEYARRKILMMDRESGLGHGHGTTNVLLERSPGVFGFGELKVHFK